MIEVPAILDFPTKLIPLVTEFNNYRYFVLESGRGGGKSHSVARLLLYLGSVKKLRIVCGREIQNSIEESVYLLLVDVINEFSLNYDITKAQITHRETGTTFRFKGMREQGAVNLKSLEGCDIFWNEEAQSTTDVTLDILIPTIRKEKSKLIFTMNRHVRTDPVYEKLAHRDDTLVLKCNYYENKHCPQALIYEANQCKQDFPQDYNHIWLGEPLATTTDYLFNFDKLAKMPDIVTFGELYKKQRILSIDFASGGGDLCVASIIERKSTVHWELIEQIAWSDPDTDASVGKSIALYGEYRPDVFIVDAGGLGYPMFISISKTVKTVIGFDGAKTDKCRDNAGNNRAEGFLNLKEFVDKEWLICKSKITIKQLEGIKKVYKSNGKIYIESKTKMDKSPDHADSLYMAVFGAVHYLGRQKVGDRPEGMRLERKNVQARSKRGKSRY